MPAFQEKLRAKHQLESLCQQAGYAVALYWEMVSPAAAKPHPPTDAAPQQNIAETRRIAQVSPKRSPSHPPSTGNLPTESLAPPSPPAKVIPPCEEKATLPLRPLAPSQPPSRQEREAVGRASSAPANPGQVLSQSDRTDSAEFKATGARCGVRQAEALYPVGVVAGRSGPYYRPARCTLVSTRWWQSCCMGVACGCSSACNCGCRT